MRCLHSSSAKRLGMTFRAVPAATRIFEPLGMQQHSRSRSRRFDRRAPRVRLQPKTTAAGSAPIKVKRAPFSATAASILRSTISRSGMRPSMTSGCCKRPSLQSSLHVLDSHRRSTDPVWIWLADHRRDALALRRNHRLSQRHRALSTASAYGHRAHESGRSRAVSNSFGDRQPLYEVKREVPFVWIPDTSDKPVTRSRPGPGLRGHQRRCARGLSNRNIVDHIRRRLGLERVVPPFGRIILETFLLSASRSRSRFTRCSVVIVATSV